MSEKNALPASEAIASAKIQIKRAHTGIVEEFTLHFSPVAQDFPAAESVVGIVSTDDLFDKESR